MSFPVNLSPSPVAEALPAVPSDPVLEQLELSQPDVSLLRRAEEHVLQYTLSSPADAADYVQLLLRVLDKASVLHLKRQQRRPTSRSSPWNHGSTAGHLSPTTAGTSAPGPGPGSAPPLHWSLADAAAAPLPAEHAMQLLNEESTQMLVVVHYAISKLCEVAVALPELARNNKRKAPLVSLASTFYPSGILVEEWRPLLRLLMSGAAGTTDAFAQRGAAYALACVLLEGRKLEKRGQLLSPVDSILESFVSWMASRLQSSSARCLQIVTPCLTVLMVDTRCREMFDDTGGIGYLSRHLRTRPGVSPSPGGGFGASVQHLYELCYCLWLLSYDCDSHPRIRHHFHRDGAVAALVDLVASAPREKVVRLALSSLRNIALCGSDGTALVPNPTSKKLVDGSTFLRDMIGCGLPKTLDLMKEREFSDPELVQDLDLLHRLLHDACKEMTRWDVYEAEVQSGHLQWSIIHSEKFFRENAKHMEGRDGNFSIVKDLLRLAQSYDDEVAAVALYDIGEFVKYYPGGRSVARRLGARDVVMKLMDHENPDMQRHALQCVSKMLVQNWQMLSRRSRSTLSAAIKY